MGKSGMPIVSASGIGLRGHTLSQPFCAMRCRLLSVFASRIVERRRSQKATLNV